MDCFSATIFRQKLNTARDCGMKYTSFKNWSHREDQTDVFPKQIVTVVPVAPVFVSCVYSYFIKIRKNEPLLQLSVTSSLDLTCTMRVSWVTVLVAAVTTAAAATTVPWYENLPAVAMDYKVHIDAGKEDCYFQFVQQGATFYASFQVLRGGDGMAGFAVRHPNGQLVHPYEWKASAEYTDQSSTGGYYSVCIDNQFSRFAGKLVNLYLTVIRYDQWDKFSKEIEEMNLNMENFTSTIKGVERNINDMLQFQYHSRGRETRDYNLLSDNNSYVMKWSIIQILVISATSALQVYFVRKLFDVKTGNTRSRI